VNSTGKSENCCDLNAHKHDTGAPRFHW